MVLHAPQAADAAERAPARGKVVKTADAPAAKRAAAAPRRATAPSAAPLAPRKVAVATAAAPTTTRTRMSAQPRARLAAAPARGSRMVKASYAPRIEAPARLSIGQAIGLHLVDDPLDLRSSVAMVIDQQTGETLYQKNADAVLPIASITKVMTSMVVLDAGLPLDEVLEITDADRDTERFSSSRMPIGARLTRGEMMQLALMASENRAANALGRHFPGGLPAFVAAMNAKAQAIGMADSRFTDPTGLSSGNVSNARDLARMVRAAHGYPLVRQYSTASELAVQVGARQIAFRSTNRLIDDRHWDIGLQKTGYISEAGKCLVMQARIDGRQTIIVLLDATATHSRFADAQRLRKWVAQHPRTEPSLHADTRS
ncbi:MAG TPA: D-alanyl-D-alanine endopeptidase [Burkholderiaceae bacterium]|nr:D-alanyl-D-alanine endopeptidase [Burkholderiaceae bacterium]